MRSLSYVTLTTKSLRNFKYSHNIFFLLQLLNRRWSITLHQSKSCTDSTHWMKSFQRKAEKSLINIYFFQTRIRILKPFEVRQTLKADIKLLFTRLLRLVLPVTTRSTHGPFCLGPCLDCASQLELNSSSYYYLNYFDYFY